MNLLGGVMQYGMKSEEVSENESLSGSDAVWRRKMEEGFLNLYEGCEA